MRLGYLACACAVCVVAAACASAPPPPPTSPVAVTPQQLMTPPPVATTPVPVVKARPVPGAGRPDPFVALFGPPTGAPPAPPKVAVSSFPNIPTLPGFQSTPSAGGIWSDVHLTGVLLHNGYTAIVESGGRSYFVRPGDSIDDKFRVISIGPDSITLATPTEQRHFLLGG